MLNSITPYANNLFEQPWWLDIVAPNNWKEIIVRNEKEEVIARQAIVIDGNSVKMPELTQTLGIWIREDIRSDYGKQKRIINEILEQLNGYKKVSFCLAPENTYVLPYRWSGYYYESRFSFRINDLSNLENLYLGFNKTAKKNIRYAKKKVSITNDMNNEQFWEMLEKTFAVQNRKCPIRKDLVERILRACIERGNGKIFCAKDSEKNIHSCAFFVYDDKVCYYLLGATDPQFRSSGAQSLVIWEGIQFAAEHSIIFDFEGSMVEGIENFFRQFNNVCIPYYCIRKRSFFSDIAWMAKPQIKKIIGYKN